MTPTTPAQGEMRQVLREPTGAMQAAGRDALEPFVGILKQPVDDQWHLARLVWAAMLAAAPSAPVVGREEIVKILQAWCSGGMLQDYASVAEAILSALHASRFAENAKQAIDPRLTEWGYSTTDEAITHLGKLLEDQAAFDGLAGEGEGYDGG